MSKLHVKTGDTVILLTGDKKDRKKTGKVLEVSPKEGKVIVEGINRVKKHVKPKKAGDPSGIIETDGAIYASKYAPSAISRPEEALKSTRTVKRTACAKSAARLFKSKEDMTCQHCRTNIKIRSLPH